jgi:hypothetical protein
MDPEIHPPRDPADKGWFRSRSGVVFLGFAAVGGFFLLTEHRAHVFQVLPWLHARS